MEWQFPVGGTLVKISRCCSSVISLLLVSWSWESSLVLSRPQWQLRLTQELLCPQLTLWHRKTLFSCLSYTSRNWRVLGVRFRDFLNLIAILTFMATEGLFCQTILSKLSRCNWNSTCYYNNKLFINWAQSILYYSLIVRFACSSFLLCNQQLSPVHYMGTSVPECSWSIRHA